LGIKEGLFEIVQPDLATFLVSQSEVKNIWLSFSTSISSAVVQTCLEKKIGLWFVDKTGKTTGCLWDLKPGSISLIRQKQNFFMRHTEGGKWAKKVIFHRMTLQLDLLLYLMKDRPGKTEELDPLVSHIHVAKQRLELLSDVPDKNMLASLRGLEGMAAKAYFECLGKLMPPGFEFPCRSRQPAKDLFNAMLNYCLGILYPLVYQNMLLAGLDPYVGVIHTAAYNRATGSYDLMENYRSRAEAASASMCIKRWVKKEEFSFEAEKVEILPECKEKIISFFLAFLDEIKQKGGKRLSRRAHIKADCHNLAQFLLHEFEVPETLEW